MWSLVIVCMLCVATCFGTADDSEVKAAASALACATLRATLPSPIVERSGSEYNATAQGTWSLFNAQDHPTCIVYPRTASHVQTAMKVIYQTKSHYAVQAGAHSAMVGWNRSVSHSVARYQYTQFPRIHSITNGVLIAFSHMTNVTYNTGKDTITVQPGVHWGAAMDAVEPFGVSVVGGRARYEKFHRPNKSFPDSCFAFVAMLGPGYFLAEGSVFSRPPTDLLRIP